MRSVAEFLLPLAISLKNSNFSKAAKVFWLQDFCCLWSYDQKITSGKYVQETNEQYIICIITHRRGRVRCFHAELQPLFHPYFILVIFLLTGPGISKSISCARKNHNPGKTFLSPRRTGFSNVISPAWKNHNPGKTFLSPRRTGFSNVISPDPKNQNPRETFPCARKIRNLKKITLHLYQSNTPRR